MSYGRDIDIGLVREISGIEVTNLEEIVSVVDAAIHKLEEAVEELKKIRLGTGLVTGVDLEEEDT